MWNLAVVLLLAAAPDTAIRQVLDAQVSAWNHGDIDTFMRAYDTQAIFVGKEVTRGYDKVLARYHTRYPTPAKMGKLAFGNLEITLLGPDYASVLGQFHLKRPSADGGDANGIFTLLFERKQGTWKILVDHTN